MIPSWSNEAFVLMIQPRPIVLDGFTTAPAMMTVPSPTSTSDAIVARGWIADTRASFGQSSWTFAAI